MSGHLGHYETLGQISKSAWSAWMGYLHYRVQFHFSAGTERHIVFGREIRAISDEIPIGGQRQFFSCMHTRRDIAIVFVIVIGAIKG